MVIFSGVDCCLSPILKVTGFVSRIWAVGRVDRSPYRKYPIDSKTCMQSSRRNDRKEDQQGPFLYVPGTEPRATFRAEAASSGGAFPQERNRVGIKEDTHWEAHISCSKLGEVQHGRSWTAARMERKAIHIGGTDV
jgi:hypothetical protein